MSHPSLAATAAPADPSACDAAAPPLTTKRRGNPDLHLAPRCGARTRAGCPCRAPAIHGKQRCRMHGGRSTGPRTGEGMARLRAARTIHGAYSAETRAHTRHDLTELRRGLVVDAARRCLDRLPADFSARLLQMPPELLPVPWPTGGLTPAQDRAVLRAEADALAPWRAAIGQAGLAGRAGKARQAVVVGRPGASAKAHAPVRHHGVPAAAQDVAASVHPASGHLTRAHPDGAHPHGAAKPLAPEREAASPASPALPAAAQSKAHAPEHTEDRRGGVPAAALTLHGGPMQQQAKAHAPERGAEDRADDRGGAIPAAAPATHGAAMQQPAKAHAPDGGAPDGGAPDRGAPERGTVASDASPATLPNRAARRRWKRLQRRMHAAPAACCLP